MAAVIGLRKAGVETVALERASDLSRVEVGAGITLWPNAVKMLDRLGVGEEVRAGGAEFSGCLEQRTLTGRPLSRWQLRDFAEALGAPAFGIRRPVLHKILATAADGAVHAGSSVTGFEAVNGTVEAKLADGSVEAGSALVGADGIGSVVRAQLHGAKPPRFSGIVIWRGVTAFDDRAIPPGALWSLWGRGTRFVVYRVGAGQMSWEATRAGGADGSDPPGGPQPELLDLFSEYCHPVCQLIEATDGRAIVRDDVCDRPPLASWGTGPVTLLGDAAHPMTFAVGQGAAQALEDAVALSAAVADTGRLEPALRAYERLRMKRTAHFQTQAWRLARMGLAASRPRTGARDAFLQTSSALLKRLQINDLRVPD